MRLLRAELIDDDGSILDVEFASSPGPGSWTTLVTGRNGSGKSRLLSAIALAFDAVDGNKPRRSVNVSVQYTLNGHDCAIHLERRRVSAFLDGQVIPIDALPRPRAVVAVTASAFDKFDLPTPEGLFAKSAQRSELYRYLGLKDARGRVSTKAGIFRALESLFEATGLDTGRRLRIAHVFDYLGYEPRVEVLYRWTSRGRSFLEAGAGEGSVGYRRFLESERAVGTRDRPILGDYFFEDPSAIDQLGAAADNLQQSSDGKGTRLVADFSALRWSEDQRFRQAQQLSRARLLEMEEVSLSRASTGVSVNIEDASSGELAIATAMLGIASSIDDQSLILMDEPEISLHPEWQADYLTRLAQTFEPFAECHFVLATHSATLVSGAHPELSNTLDIEESQGARKEVSPGKSADEVLVRTFGVAQDGNLYVRQLLIEALRLVADRRTTESRFSEVLEKLQRVDSMLPDSSPMRQVIADLGRTRFSSDGARA
nr:AAA family ATPase [Microbacterium proteolyticum]